MVSPGSICSLFASSNFWVAFIMGGNVSEKKSLRAWNVGRSVGTLAQHCNKWWEIIKRNQHTHKLLACLLTYLLTPCSRVLLEKLTGSQLVKKVFTFYGTWRFITAFTSDHHPSLSWARSIQSMTSHPTSWMIQLNIIFPYMHGSSKWSPSLRFLHQNTVYAPPLPHTSYMPHPSHSPWFNHPNNIWWAVQIIKLLLM